jgi:hypothetical protein
MSTLRTYNVQNPDSAATNIQLSANGGIAVAGIVTATGGLTVGAGASVVGVITATGGFSGNVTGNVTGTVNSSGIATFSNGLVVSAGTTAAPSISPTGDSNTGIFFPSADTIAFGEGGSEALRIDSSGRVGLNTNIASGAFYNRFVINSPDSSCWMSLHSTQTGSVVNSDGIDIGLNGSNQGHFWLRENADLLIATNNTERVRIDSSGRVQMPYQPYARASSTSTTGSTNAIPLNSNSSYNYSRGGITISGNRFTVPVAGAYVIGYHHLGNSGSGACQMEIRHNGSYIPGTRTQDTNSSNDSFGTQTIKELSASDYVEFWVIQGAAHGNQDYNSMWIWLIG